MAFPNREDYIVDDDSDEENDCEQSDLVNIMLNLAYLKEGYAKEISMKKGFAKSQARQSLMYRTATTMIGNKYKKQK